MAGVPKREDSLSKFMQVSVTTVLASFVADAVYIPGTTIAFMCFGMRLYAVTMENSFCVTGRSVNCGALAGKLSPKSFPIVISPRSFLVPRRSFEVDTMDADQSLVRLFTLVRVVT